MHPQQAQHVLHVPDVSAAPACAGATSESALVGRSAAAGGLAVLDSMLG